MADAKKLYEDVCNYMDKNGWKYTREEESLRIRFSFSGDDIELKFVVVVDEKLQILRLLSYMPFSTSKEKMIDLAIAACAATHDLIEGSFDYDVNDGEIRFRMATPYMGCELSESVFDHMLNYAIGIVDEYNDKFLAISKGYLSVEQFLKEN